MKESEKLYQFLEEYKIYVTAVLQPTRIELKNILDEWRVLDYWKKYSTTNKSPSPAPIQRAFSRIKRPESVVDKILRKHLDYPEGLSKNSLKKMNDALGTRILLYFMSQFPIIDRELQNHPKLEISKKNPPVAFLSQDLTRRLGLKHLQREDKESGYASIHYIARLKDSEVPEEKRPWIEIQVRTLAEDVWGEIEHILGYKPNKRTAFPVRRHFQILSTQLSTIDELFNLLYEELSRYQVEISYQENDPLNAENIPSVLSELGIGCSQREVDGQIKLLVSHGIKTIHDLKELGTTNRIETIRNTYRHVLGRNPIDFEVVANLATLIGVEDEEEELDLIKTQILFLETWDSLKKSFKK